MALSIRSYEGFRVDAGVAFNNAHARVGGCWAIQLMRAA